MRDSRRRAKRQRVAVLEPHSARRELIEVRRLEVHCAVTAEVPMAEIIRHDEDDVRLLRGVRNARSGSQHHGHGEEQDSV